MRKKLGISLPRHNFSVASGTPTVLHAMLPNQLVLVLPPSHVVTVQKALGSGGGAWINKCALKLPRTLPRRFVLAMYVLHERYLGPSRGLMRLWLESLPPLENATVFWTDAELEALEEERAIKRSRSRREELHSEYDSMVRILLDDGCSSMAEDLEDIGVQLERHDYVWATTVVSRHAWHLAPDFPVLVPLSIRFHLRAAADVAEWGSETEPGASLYVGSEAALRPGDELTAFSETSDNLELLLDAGYLWHELGSSRVQLRLSATAAGASLGVVAVGAGAHEGAAEAKRRAWLAGANWTDRMDFELSGDGHLNLEMMAWLRLVLATSAEVASARSLDDFRAPLSAATDDRAYNALLVTLESTLGRYDFSVEEDEALLRAIAKEGVAARGGAAARHALAVSYRLLCKRVLLRTQALATAQYRQSRRQLSDRPVGEANEEESEDSPVSVVVTATGDVIDGQPRKVGKKKRRRRKDRSRK